MFTIRELADALLRDVPATEELITCAKHGRGAAVLFCHGDYMTRGIYALKLADKLTAISLFIWFTPTLIPIPG